MHLIAHTRCVCGVPCTAQACLAKAHAAYAEVAVGEESIRRAHEARWVAAVGARYKDARGRRLAEAAAAVNEMLYKAATEVAQVRLRGSWWVSRQRP